MGGEKTGGSQPGTPISVAPPVPPPPAASAMAYAVLQFTFSSVCMMIGNKAAIGALPLPCTLVVIQAVGTLVLLAFFRSQVDKFSTATAKTWLPIAILFTAMLYTSLQSFVYATVSTVIILRNVGAIFTTVTEYFVRGVTVNAKIVLSEVAIVAGAVLYGYASVEFNGMALFWILVNVGFQVAYGVLIKRQMDSHPEIREMSKFTMSMYNNALAIPMIVVVLLARGEQAMAVSKLAAVTPVGWSIVLATCVVGFMISTSGFGLQKLVSATTFLVINNLTKFFNILLSMVFLADKFAGGTDVAGCLVALGAGCWYSYESMQLAEEMRRSKALEGGRAT